METFGCPPVEQEMQIFEEKDVIPKEARKVRLWPRPERRNISGRLCSLGLKDEIRKFADAEHWLEYFPPLVIENPRSSDPERGDLHVPDAVDHGGQGTRLSLQFHRILPTIMPVCSICRKGCFPGKVLVTDEMVLPYNPISIIDVLGLGKLSVVYAYDKFKVQSHNDRAKLQEVKEPVYLQDFYDGVLLVGEHAGKKVQNMKKDPKQSLVDRNEADVYYEPEKTIMSRSGDVCMVALCATTVKSSGKRLPRSICT